LKRKKIFDIEYTVVSQSSRRNLNIFIKSTFQVLRISHMISSIKFTRQDNIVNLLKTTVIWKIIRNSFHKTTMFIKKTRSRSKIKKISMNTINKFVSRTSYSIKLNQRILKRNQYEIKLSSHEDKMFRKKTQSMKIQLVKLKINSLSRVQNVHRWINSTSKKKSIIKIKKNAINSENFTIIENNQWKRTSKRKRKSENVESISKKSLWRYWFDKKERSRQSKWSVCLQSDYQFLWNL
jgi:hypothetical protein